MPEDNDATNTDDNTANTGVPNEQAGAEQTGAGATPADAARADAARSDAAQPDDAQSDDAHSDAVQSDAARTEADRDASATQPGATDAAPSGATAEEPDGRRGDGKRDDGRRGDGKRGGGKRGNRGRGDSSAEVRRELDRMVELAPKYPEIGPPLAELAYKLGFDDIGERVVRLGSDEGGRALEYAFVRARAARREGRGDDALTATVEAVRAFAETGAEGRVASDSERLLHLVRHGFATLMFDIGDVTGAPAFTAGLAEALPTLESELGENPFYRSLLAQTLWLTDRERSEAEWDRAAALDDPELVWNARGTWYKEAEKDEDKAERTYRKGLEAAPRSALLLHNLAQVMVEKAARPDVDTGQTRRLLAEAEDLLRAALRQDAPRVRRHIHATLDRLYDLRKSLPPRRGKSGGRGRGRDDGRRDDRGDQRRNDRRDGEQRGGEARRDDQGGDRREGRRGDNRRRDDRRGPNRRDDRRGPNRRDDRVGRDPDKPFPNDGRFRLGEVVLAKLKEREGKD